MLKLAKLPDGQEVRWFSSSQCAEGQEAELHLPGLHSGVVPAIPSCLFDVIPRRTQI